MKLKATCKIEVLSKSWEIYGFIKYGIIFILLIRFPYCRYHASFGNQGWGQHHYPQMPIGLGQQTGTSVQQWW